jgi:hypothetical protein
VFRVPLLLRLVACIVAIVTRFIIVNEIPTIDGQFITINFTEIVALIFTGTVAATVYSCGNHFVVVVIIVVVVVINNNISSSVLISFTTTLANLLVSGSCVCNFALSRVEFHVMGQLYKHHKHNWYFGGEKMRCIEDT